LWYKRRNDDNFKISLSQVFLQSSSSCYYSDKSNKNAASNANMINLEEELCELLHENGQLKNFLKEVNISDLFCIFMNKWNFNFKN
jgi:hypothetical protein